MSNAYNPNTHHFSIPYLTLDEFKNAPTGIEIDNMVYNSSDPNVQDAELYNVIMRASSWIDNYCNQVLAATHETEQGRGRFKPNGDLVFHPKCGPITALTALNFGLRPDQFISVPDCNKAWIEDFQIIYPNGQSFGTSSAGPLQLGAYNSPRQQVYLNYTYVSGYVNTTLITTNPGDTSIEIADATGIIAGLTLKIYDGINSEFVTVNSFYNFGDTVIPLVNPIVNYHATGVSISALPAAIKEACILLTVALLKSRGDSALVMRQGNAPGEVIAVADKGGSDIAMAKQLLNPYRRVR